MIIFRKLALQNFMSYRDRVTVPLSGQGVVRIEGRNLDDSGATSNMAGKSTIIEALLWCLFGKTMRGLKHNEIINRKAKKNCVVEVLFEIHKIPWAISRYRRHSKHGNEIRILRDGKSIAYRHAADSQAEIERVLDCEFYAFVNSTVFGGFDGARKQFALLADSDQKRILDSFLKFEKFELAHKRTKVLLEETKSGMNKNSLLLAEQNGKVSTYREKASTLRDSLALLANKEKEDRQKLRLELARLKLVDVHRFDGGIGGAEEQVEIFSTKLINLRGSQGAAHRSLNQLRKIASDRKSMVGKRCPTCGQIVKLPAAGLEDHIKLEMISVRKELDRFSAREVKIERKVTHWRNRLKRLTSKKQNLMATKRHRKEIELELAKRETIVQSPLLEKLEDTKTKYSKAVGRYLVLLQVSKELENKIKALEFWEAGFGNKGVKTLVMREMLPSMNSKLREYASKIFRLPVELEFRPSKTTKKGDERELFHLHYKSKFNSASYTGESSGGRRRIDICVLLVFSWLARCSNLLLVDELLDGLDESGRETTLDILSKQRGSVFVITHSRQLKSSIGKVWTVTKKDGASRLEMAYV